MGLTSCPKKLFMDIASVVGLIGAIALIVMAMGDPVRVDTASILIVFGGSIMATLYRSTSLNSSDLPKSWVKGVWRLPR